MCFPKCVCRLVFTGVFAASLFLTTDGFAQADAIPQISAVDATNYLGRQVVVVDKVVQVAMRSNIWLLHLNQKFPHSPLNAVIRKAATNNFPNIDQYLGQRVEITGQISEYRGRLELALTTPGQIKILDASAQYPVAASAVAGPIQTPSSSASPAAPVVVPVPPPAPDVSSEVNSAALPMNWIIGLLAAIASLLAAGLFLFWRRTPARPPLSEVPALLPPPAAAGADVSADDWKQRALAAEAMAGKQGQILREKMIPELTEFAKQSLVQGLYAQRNVLLETQLKAQQALAELETRLNAVQAPLHERIRAYEQRIAELEREVETQGEEMRELTRATLALVRRKLEDERSHVPLNNRFN